MSGGAIRALAPEVADAIAAGEVVERPTSVVKELLENSLDAGARRITIEIRGAGRTLIRVADDGDGIPSEELRLAFTRHATSKVSTLEDLVAISSLGFRGEALASVAAVSDVECVSSGHRVRIRAGHLLEEGAAAAAPGTVIEVRDLFANTPARLKFMKSDPTETSACVRIVQQYALLHPLLRFRVLIDGRTVLNSPGGGDAIAAAASVHGAAAARELVEADHVEDGLRVSGLVSQPHLSRGNRDGMVLAVNGRPISSRALSYALEECYRGSLERGRFPVAILSVELDPAAVDVNVHPAKREVKFREESAVFAALQKAVRAGLAGSRLQRFDIPIPAFTVDSPRPAARQMELHQGDAYSPTATAGTATAQGLLRPVGQILDGYLVAEGPEGLVLVDQHAAHERVLFNRFTARLDGEASIRQPLLLPTVIELEPAQVSAIVDHRGSLEALGFEYEPFGPRSIRLLAGPAETPAGRVEGAFIEIAGVLAAGRRDESLDAVLASLACHSAVRFGDSLEPAEQRRLLQELEATMPDATCPHGRPTRLLLDWQTLKRHFRRNY